MIVKLVILALPVDFFSFTIPLWILTILGFLIAFAITYFAIPIIVKNAKQMSFYARPNHRTSHTKPTPVFGGVAIFSGFIISMNIVAGKYFNFELSYLITGLIIIFIIGIKDDLTGSEPWKRILAQIMAIAIISVLADIRISNLYKLFGIGDIPYLISIVLTIFVLIVILNGFNLIDGIDGLASGVGILSSSILGLWFYVTNNIACTVMSFALTGALIAFFYFNVFSKRNKIFLGDTGSLVIGLVMGILMVRFLQLEPAANGIAVINSTPAFAVSLFILPLFDSLRVFIIRIAQGKSPFHADHQHIHHRLLELGFNHLQTTIILLSVNMAFIVLCFLLQDLGNIYLIGIQLALATILSYMLLIQVKKKNRKLVDPVV